MSTVDAVPALIPTGAVIGRRYRIDGLLAEGGMGIVYKGFHLALQQPIAIKVVRAEFADRPDAVARFLNEARALAGLRGPHIAQVLDVGRMGNGPPYMVLEYLDGEDLRTVLDVEGPFSTERAICYALEACEALADAHARGIVHRDIKPENLFLTGPRDGTELVKLIDFGVSKRLDPQARSYTEEGQSLGSPHYMAPEQMTKPHEVDARADIWSLGVVLFELLSGAVPFEGETLPEACASILCAEPRSLRALQPSVPPELERVVLRCLAKAPSERYADVAQLAAALMPFAGPEGRDSLRHIRRSLGQHGNSKQALLGESNAPRPTTTQEVPIARVPRTNPNCRLPKKSLWSASLAFVAAGLTAWMAVTHFDGIFRAIERTGAEARGVATFTAENLAPAALRAVAAARLATREVAARFESPKGEGSTQMFMPPPAPAYSRVPVAPTGIDTASMPARF